MVKKPTHISPYLQNNTYSKKQHTLEKPPHHEQHSNTSTYINPSTPNNDILVDEWIKTTATIARTANKEARKITTKYNRECIRKDISKYRQLYDKSPKKIHQKVFKNNKTQPLDYILNPNGDIITNPEDISNKIYSQQTVINKRTVPTCYHQTTHIHNCICNVKQYPWHDLDGFTIEI